MKPDQNIMDIIDPDTRERMRIDRSIWKDRANGRRIVYVIGPEGGHPCKIGYAANLWGRLYDLQVSHWERIVIHHCGYCFDKAAAADIERAAHRILEDKALRGEWFDVTPAQAIKAVTIAAKAVGADFVIADVRRVRAAMKK